MNSYNDYLPLADGLKQLHPKWGSDRVANEISKGYPDINVASLGRIIRMHWSKDNSTSQKEAKVLLFDIETSLMETLAFTKYPNSIHDDCILSDVFMISWAAKWLFDDNIISMKLTPKEAIAKNDKRITKGLWELFEEADVVIAHNAKKFDIRVANTRFAKHKMGLPTPYEVIDTLQHYRKVFRLPSNRLDFIAKNLLGIEGKHHTTIQLWIDSMKGDKDALKTMDEYCVNDTAILEDAYLFIRPYIKPHPNMGFYIGSDVELCHVCGSDDLQWKGTYRTQVSEYNAYRCNSCKAIGRERKNKTTKEVKERLVRS